jgi:hypothetical protein
MSQSQPVLGTETEKALQKMKKVAYVFSHLRVSSTFPRYASSCPKVFKFDEAEKALKAQQEADEIRKEESMRKAEESKIQRQKRENLRPTGAKPRVRRQMTKMKAEKRTTNASHKHDKASASSGLALPTQLDHGSNEINYPYPQEDQFYEDESCLFYDDDDDDDDESGEDGGLDLDEWMNKWAIE